MIPTISAWNMHGENAPALSPEAKIRANYAEFSWFLDLTKEAFAAGRSQAACVYATMAAQIAAHRHCGFFASPQLERMLNHLGRQIHDTTSYRRPSPAPQPKKILHVCTEVVDVGGHSKMVARWMNEDVGRQHSMVLTQHSHAVPEYIASAVSKAGGELHRLDLKPRNFMDRALDLRRLARGYDLIVLNVYAQDVIPMLAFATLESVPPVVFLNHADHMFWLGPSVSDVVINLRDAAEDLSIHRRGVPLERNVMVPTLVGKTYRKRSKTEAKQLLGLDPDGIMLLSAARGSKYRTLSGETFADTHVPVLADNPNAVMMVLGVGDAPDWAPAQAAVGGRIHALAPTPDPTVYFEAADIYVDSFPFVSSTSMMEAAGYSLPMVSRFYASREASIIGINHPGLIVGSLSAANDAEYVALLRRMIAEPEYRDRLGAIAQKAVADLHTTPGWLDLWQRAIDAACSLPPLDGSRLYDPSATETPQVGEPDIRMNDLFGFQYTTAWLMKPYLKHLPLLDRYSRWKELRAAGAFERRAQAAWYMLPEWALRLLSASAPPV